jgi:putative membrane-bound dehydrogenase-like protein
VRRLLLLLPLLLVTFQASGGRQPPGNPAPTGGVTPPARPGFHQVTLNGHTFTLPVGFTIELAAKPPQVERPIVAAFDDRGGLYVCDSSGSNEKVAVQVEKKPHRIVRLESTRGDGVYDKSTVFVKNVMFPEGAMWLAGSLYVAAPPHIWKFTDTDGDGVADKQEVWFDGKTLTGCANDLHGPYPGPDGWIYWCKGAFAKQEYTLPNGKKFTTRAAHIFRAKPDGSNIEPVMTGGMDNPVDVVFTPGGERIFSTTFFQRPGDGKRDGLVHAVYGGVYGKDHDPVYEHPWTSPAFMPVLTHMGPAAPCGLHRYESDQFGAEYRDNVFCCQFNLRKVSRHVLVPTGSTFTTKDSDFVVSDNLDFHPTDVIEDADGSLLIVDTGGWYKLCCPTSQLVKPDVTGAIYRVKKVGAHKVDDPRGLAIQWDKLDPKRTAMLMMDRRPEVARQAADRFARAADADVDTATGLMAANLPRPNRLTILRAFHRGGHAGQVRRYLRDGDPVVASAAAHLVGLNRDKQAASVLTMMLSDPNRHIRRAAAEALGRIGDPDTVGFILAALTDEKNDRALDHSLTYALIEIGNVDAVDKGRGYESPRARRAALAALDAMPGGNLTPEAVLGELDAKDAALRETAWWVAGKHPEWGDRLAGYFREQLKVADKLPQPARDELADRLAKFAKNEAIQKLLGETRTGNAAADRIALRAMARSGLKALPAAWEGRVIDALVSRTDVRHWDAIAVLRAVQASKDFYDRALILEGPLPTDPSEQTFRMQLIAAAPPGYHSVSEYTIRFGIQKLHKDMPAEVRAATIEYLLRARITAEALVELAAALKTVGPVELAKLLPAFDKSKDEKVGRALVSALSDPAVRAAVRAEQVKPILDKYPKPVRDEAEKLYALLAEARKGESEKLERLVKELPAGDVRRGQLVFNGAKGQCAACHKIGYVGGLVGPDLTRIGGIRTERDLLESIVFPSASFVRSYEPVRVRTADGRTLNGIIKKDAPDELVLAVAADKEERVARADVEEVSPSSVSLMPAGLDQQLSVQELADLVAFLRACK